MKSGLKGLNCNLNYLLGKRRLQVGFYTFMRLLTSTLLYKSTAGSLMSRRCHQHGHNFLRIQVMHLFDKFYGLRKVARYSKSACENKVERLREVQDSVTIVQNCPLEGKNPGLSEMRGFAKLSIPNKWHNQGALQSLSSFQQRAFRTCCC